MQPHDASRTHFHDDSDPVPGSEYPAVAMKALAAYYADMSPGMIDLENLTVQIEEFSWRNASYRIDLFFSQKPSFLPLNSDYVMAHRLWMRRSGAIIKSEPVYRSPNLEEGVSVASIPRERRGFFPGNRAFRKELEFIDRALRKARRVEERQSGSGDAPVFALDTGCGLEFLEAVRAAILERKDDYRVTFEWDESIAGGALIGAGYGPNTLIELEVKKSDGTVTPFSTRHYVPPALG